MVAAVTRWSNCADRLNSTSKTPPKKAIAAYRRCANELENIVAQMGETPAAAHKSRSSVDSTAIIRNLRSSIKDFESVCAIAKMPPELDAPPDSIIGSMRAAADFIEAMAPAEATATEPRTEERFVCDHCQVIGVVVDEDGCCQGCGANTRIAVCSVKLREVEPPVQAWFESLPAAVPAPPVAPACVGCGHVHPAMADCLPKKTVALTTERVQKWLGSVEKLDPSISIESPNAPYFTVGEFALLLRELLSLRDESARQDQTIATMTRQWGELQEHNIALRLRETEARELLRTWPMAACIKFGMADIDSARSIAAKQRMDEYDEKVRAYLAKGTR